MATRRSLLLLVSIAVSTNGDFPFRNVSLPWKERVDDLVGRLTVEEMSFQMAKAGAGPMASPTPAIPRLGIKPWSWSNECLRGVVLAGPATSFPQALGLSATFSTDIIYRVAEAGSIELRAKYNNYTSHGEYGDHKGITCFSPVVNIMRDPRWGRNQETYGEDPYMSGEFATGFIHGLQGNDSRYIRASSGCKHFDVHGGPDNYPTSRFTFDANVTTRDWRTTFLPAFKKCVEAGTFSLMCSFNKINGVPSCVNNVLLTDILRHEWNFTGYVVTDEGGLERIIYMYRYFTNRVDTAAAAAIAGTNLQISKNDPRAVFLAIPEAVKEGKLNMSTVQERVWPLFYTRMRLGEFDPPEMVPYTAYNLSVIQSEAHRELSLEAAMKSFILLKNVDKFLPLKKNHFDTIAIVGPMANNSVQMYGDYAPTIDPRYFRTPLQGLTSLATTVQYASGCDDNVCAVYKDADVKKAVGGAEVVFVVLGTGQQLEMELNDRHDMNLPGYQLQLLQDAVQYAKGAPVVLLLLNAGPLNVTWAVENPNVRAILEMFFPAQSTGEAVRKVLLKEGPNSVPAARTPCTWYKYADQVPPITNYSMAGRTYRYFKGDVLFPFGYGLSYTSFHYDEMVLQASVQAGDDLHGYVVVSNTGDVDADEIIQLYITWGNPSVPTPNIQLVGFNRVSIPAGGKTQWNFTISAESMAVWTDCHGWMVESGPMRLNAGGQQPFVSPSVGSNVLETNFDITGPSKMLRHGAK